MHTSPSYTPLTPSHPHHTPRRNLPARLACLALLSLPLALLILSIIIYLDPSQSMPICLPFSLARISTTLHRKISCQSPLRTASSVAGVNEMSSGHQFGKLGGFLQSQKDLFLADLREGNLRGWTVAMGNEAGGKFTSCQTWPCRLSDLSRQTSTPLPPPSPSHASHPCSMTTFPYQSLSHLPHSCPSAPRIYSPSNSQTSPSPPFFTPIHFQPRHPTCPYKVHTSR